VTSYILISLGFFTFWLFVWRFWDKKKPEPFWALILAAVLGACVAFWINTMARLGFFVGLEESLGGGALLVFVFVVIEEVGKLGAFILGTRVYSKHFDELVDGLSYGAATALGFAFLENILYFQAFDGGAVFIFIRSIDGMLAHALFTGIFAFYFAVAFAPMKIGKRRVPVAGKYRLSVWQIVKDFFVALSFHVTRRHILAHRPSKHLHRRSEVLFEGFWIAVLGHFIHNFATSLDFLGDGILYVFLVILVLLSWFAFSLFRKNWYVGVAKKKRAVIDS
jgi:RsiW-degrading membrane proteinase PrsW (M82 family)